MIIQNEKIEVKISNNGSYYRNLGYGLCKQRDIIFVDMNDLPKQSQKKVLCSCDRCGVQFYRQYELVIRHSIHRCRLCERKFIGKTMDRAKIDAATKTRVGLKHPRWNPNKSALLTYARQVRWISEKVYKAHKHILNPDNFPRTKCGVHGGYQLDHKISVKEGFEKGIPVDRISHMSNLQMLPWKENRTKGASLTKESYRGI